MKIAVGSKNAAKVKAVEELLKDYPHLKDAEVIGYEVDSGIPAQPKSLAEIVEGACNRAKHAYDIGADYGVGLEAGLMEVPHSKSGHMDITAAAVFDGTEYHLGLSSAWEFVDPSIFREVIEGEKELATVLVDRKVFASMDERQGGGAIGIVTKGRLDRKGFTQQALMNALIHIDP
jgi:inosine/xanthosine triphosphatase